jgi:iron(III) transport system substrate-binding protein
MTDWEDLLDESVVAIPDPSFAGSAFGALAYFALDERYGLEFLERLAANGAVQVNSPGDVVSGVAEGIYDAGITLDFSVRSALADGSPVQLVWPESGAIAIYSPIAVVASSSSGAAEAFVEYVLSQPGQATIGATGWEPVREDVPWDVGGPQVNVDWAGAFDRQEELLGGYRAIFEGE